MSRNACIVCYGSDDRLLETRRWVLETAGFAVSWVTSDVAFRDSLRSGLIDLILLCHSLSSEQVEGAMHTIEGEQLSIPVLKLAAGTISPIHDGIDITLDAMEGPRVLISAVQRLLHCS